MLNSNVPGDFVSNACSNGATIRQVKRKTVTYHHIELLCHDVVLAEGLPAESYLDTGDRTKFSGGGVIALHPEFVARTWEMRACAALVSCGPVLDSIRRRAATHVPRRPKRLAA